MGLPFPALSLLGEKWTGRFRAACTELHISVSRFHPPPGSNLCLHYHPHIQRLLQSKHVVGA